MPRPDHPPSLAPAFESLAAASPPVAELVLQTLPAMRAGLSEADMARWLTWCTRLATCGWRSAESAEAFIQVSPFLLRRLSAAQLWQWAEHGETLAHVSAGTATSFFRAARAFVQQTACDALPQWVADGKWYLQQHPTFSSLAETYFEISPTVYGQYSLADARVWGQLGHDFARLGWQPARDFLSLSRSLLEQAPEVDFAPAWRQARRMLPQAAKLALEYLEHYPDYVQRFGDAGTAALRDVVDDLLAPQATDAEAFLHRVRDTLILLSAAECLQALTWCRQISAVSHAGTLAFLGHLNTLRERLPDNRVNDWINAGIDVAKRQAPAGAAYFGIESATALDNLQALQKRVEFAAVEPVLRLYAHAILGRRMDLKVISPLLPDHHPPQTRDAHDYKTGLRNASEPSFPRRACPRLDRGRESTNPGKSVDSRFHGSDASSLAEVKSTFRQTFPSLQRTPQGGRTGAAIYLPPRMDAFDSAAHNFGAYKVIILHQAGFYEGGTFAFDLDACRRRLPTLPAASDGNGLSSFQGFFNTFAEPDLARSLFAILEDTRIDAWIARHYKGIRDDLGRLMQYSRNQRPPLHDMPLRQALLEGLLQLSLGAETARFEPPTLRLLLQRLMPLTQALHAPTATVYDTAAAVLQAYRLLTQIPNDASLTFTLNAADLLSALDLSLADDDDTLALADLFRAAGDAADRTALADGDAPATGVEAVPYRGAVKPDVIEKKMRLNELEDALHRHDGLSPLSPEALKALLENDGLDIRSLQRGEVNATTGLFVSNLQGRPADAADTSPPEFLREQAELLRAELRAAETEPARLPQTFHYDEWDYLIGDYRRAWCRLREMPLDDGGPDFVADTRRVHGELLAQVKRQFQLLKPEQFKTVKPLTDGETIDLDSAVEALVDRRAGHALADKVYARRDKHDRSVAAVFLLDMSASTDDKIKNPDGCAADDGEPQRRIIDIEKEALVLMAEALEALGDAYAVYGFSGYGRDQVDAFVVKSFDEPYDRRIQGRIAAIEPHRSTRMGPVIRHAAAQLGRQEARLKALILLSDGYPQDFDYGQDRKSKEYGLQDTTKALQEARLKAIHAFCVTVDPGGHDYLRQMCPDQQYLVIDDMAALPRELPKVYRGLTA